MTSHCLKIGWYPSNVSPILEWCPDVTSQFAPAKIHQTCLEIRWWEHDTVWKDGVPKSSGFSLNLDTPLFIPKCLSYNFVPRLEELHTNSLSRETNVFTTPLKGMRVFSVSIIRFGFPHPAECDQYCTRLHSSPGNQLTKNPNKSMIDP